MYLQQIQLSRLEGWEHINLCNHNIYVFLFQARTWIPNVICGGSFVRVRVRVRVYVFRHLRWEVIVPFVDIGGIVDHHCLNYPLLILVGLLTITV